MKNLGVSVALVLLLAANAWAQENTPRADNRQGNQRARISDGRQSGDLTAREAARLNQQQRHVRRAERRAKADGDVSVRERARLERKQDRASRNIRRQKNDAQQRPR
ncbi:MAG: hypothetical protein ACK5DD_14400 [Cyclobacteriaceae bacterium]